MYFANFSGSFISAAVSRYSLTVIYVRPLFAGTNDSGFPSGNCDVTYLLLLEEKMDIGTY